MLLYKIMSVSKLYELCQQLGLSRPQFRFYQSRCKVQVKEIGKAEGFGYDEKIAKKEAAENLLSAEKAQELLAKVAAKYTWANMEHKNKRLLAKLLVIRAEAIAFLLLNNEHSAEVHCRCNNIAKKMAVLLADFDE